MYRLSSIFCDFSHYTAENQPYTICCAVKIFCGVYVGMVIWGMKNAGSFHPRNRLSKNAPRVELRTQFYRAPFSRILSV